MENLLNLSMRAAAPHQKDIRGWIAGWPQCL